MKHLKLLSLLAAVLFAGSMMADVTYDAETPKFTNTTKNSYFKSYCNNTITISTPMNMSSGSGDYYVSIGATPGNAGSYYIEVASTSSAIATVEFLCTGNGTDKSCQPALLGWKNTAAESSADVAYVNDAVNIANKGVDNAQWLSYDVSSDDVKIVRFYRAVKGVAVGSYGTKSTIGNAQTLQLYGVRVILKSAGPVDPTVTFNDANYEIGKTLDLATLFTSNSEGTVTYTVKDAGTTGATISGTNFTATAVGTAVVTASQAATASYNAKTADATITVNAPATKNIYYVNTNDWTTVKAYMWKEGSDPLVKNADWSGADMTKVDGVTVTGHDVYSYEYAANATFDKVIFNDGGSNQTGNINLEADKYYFKDAWKTQEEIDAIEKRYQEEQVAISLVGNFNNWDVLANQFENSELNIDLAANTDYKFKIYDYTVYYSCYGDATMTKTNADGVVWNLGTGEGYNDITLKTDLAGEYKFHWDGYTHKLIITYPLPRTTAPTITCTDNVVTISCLDDEAEIYYTINGTAPTASSNHYTMPFAIVSNCTVMAIAVKEGYTASNVTSENVTYVAPVIEGTVVYQLNPTVGSHTTVGTAAISNNEMSFGNGIDPNSTGKPVNYLEIKPANGGFLKGDIVTFIGYISNKDQSKVGYVAIAAPNTETTTIIFTSEQLKNTNSSGSNYGTPVAQSYTLTNDYESLFIARAPSGNTTTKISSFSVTRPATDVVVATPSINAYGYGTFSCQYDTRIEGASVYTAWIENGEIRCTRVSSNQVPANTGVLLYKEEVTEKTTATAYYVASAKAISASNSLLATTGLENMPTYAYTLSGTTFKHFTGSSLPAGKAFFGSDEPLAGDGAPIRIVLPGETGPGIVTDVESVHKYVNTSKAIINGKLYVVRENKVFDLNGRFVK